MIRKKEKCPFAGRGGCPFSRQDAMENWLLDVVAARFQHQWAIRDEMGREEPKAFFYMLPHEHRDWLKTGPCKGCPVERVCRKPCALRLKWWDDCLGHHRC